MAKKSNSELFSALLYLLIGVLLVVFRDRTLHWAMTIAGVIFLVFGVVDLIRSDWGSGTVSLIIGVAILVLGWALTEIVILVLGLLIAVKGIVALVEAIRHFRKNIVEIIFSTLTIAIGLLLAFGNVLGTMILIAGIMLIVDGVFGLIGTLVKK